MNKKCLATRAITSSLVGLLSLTTTTALLVSCGGRLDPEDKASSASIGTVSLPLSTVGASGTVYRLRNAIFEMRNINTGELFARFTEDDPTLFNLITTVPAGDYEVELLPGWFMERDAPPFVEPVNANLVSPPVLVVPVAAGGFSNVSFQFATSTEPVVFGDGDLNITIDVDEGGGAQATGSVIETSVEALSGLSLREVLDRALAESGRAGTADEAYRTMIDSYTTAANGLEPLASHCDDQPSESTPTGLNGFPLECPRQESAQINNLDFWFPIAVVNRMDLAPADGGDCGQARIIFANNEPIGASRMLMIIEAVVPNPDAACGVAGCFPIAQFWSDLGNEPDPFIRSFMIRDAFLDGFAIPGVPAFINADQLGPNGGQVRTNNFNTGVWTLREFQFEAAPTATLRPAPTAESPNGELWNDLGAHSAGPLCRTAFIDAVPGLLTDNLAQMSLVVPEECKDAESRNDSSEDYAFHLSNGGGAFELDLNLALSGTGLSAQDLANRARFAGSCIGCHQEASGLPLGNGVVAPNAFGFVHVDEQFPEPCLSGQCFRISDALRDDFLPHRQNVLSQLLDAGPACVPLAPLSARTSKAATRTLGGQMASKHGH